MDQLLRDLRAYTRASTAELERRPEVDANDTLRAVWRTTVPTQVWFGRHFKSTTYTPNWLFSRTVRQRPARDVVDTIRQTNKRSTHKSWSSPYPAQNETATTQRSVACTVPVQTFTPRRISQARSNFQSYT